MRRLLVLVLVGTLALTFVGSPASRAATVASSWPVGAAPFGLALDSFTGKVFVANSGTVVSDASNPSITRGRVSVVNPASGSVETISTSQISNFVLTDSANRRLYSSNYNFSTMQSSVDAFDLDGGASIASVPGVGGLMLALDAPAGRLFVGGNSLTVIDTTTNAAVASLPPPPSRGWFGVAVDPERHRLFLADSDTANPRIVVLDDRDLSSVGVVNLGNAVRYAIAADPGRDLLYVAGSNPNGAPGAAFYVIDPESLTILESATLEGFPLGIALAPARGRVYVSTQGGIFGSAHLYGIDDSTFAVAETMRITQFQPGWPLFHSDGRLYIGNYNDTGNPVQNPAQDSTLLAIDLNDHAPIFQSLALTPATPFTADTLHANASAIDPDFSASLAGDPVTYTYEWSRNGTPIAGAIGPTLDLSVAGNGDRGDTISVRVAASDGQLSTVASTSVVIANSAPTAAVSLNNSAPATNAVLSASAVASDPDNDPLIYRFIWSVNGATRRTSSGLNPSDSFDLGPAGNGDHGDGVVVQVVASDGMLESAVSSAGATVVNSAPTVAISLNTTTPATKSVLIATVLGQDVDSDGLTYVYTWRLNGVVKRTVTTTSTTDRYDLSVRGNGDKGDVVTVTATATDGSLTSPSASVSVTVRNH